MEEKIDNLIADSLKKYQQTERGQWKDVATRLEKCDHQIPIEPNALTQLLLVTNPNTKSSRTFGIGSIEVDGIISTSRDGIQSIRGNRKIVLNLRSNVTEGYAPRLPNAAGDLVREWNLGNVVPKG